MTAWLVRARNAQLLDDFLEKGVVAIGWKELGDLRAYATRGEMLGPLRDAFPSMKPGGQRMSAGQLFRFVHEFREGDRVLTYDPQRRVYHLGTVVGGYEYHPDLVEDNPNVHRVRWEGEVERDDLSARAKNGLGSISTLFQLSEEVAHEVESIFTGRPLGGLGVEPGAESDAEVEGEALAFERIQNQSLELIKDRVSAFGWEEMQELVAGLLRAMGYKTRVSPPGPKGKDIVASPDGFGFENPRIVVEVKHRSGAMGAQAIRSFLGGRHEHDKGLFVSTGGFTKDAYYEAERAKIPLTLLSIDELVQALLDYYDELDLETQHLLPLEKFY